MSPAGASPLRWLSPAQLGICVVLFFLPWIEIQCGQPDFANLGIPGNVGNPQNPQAPVKPELKVAEWVPFMTQSGLQAATGEFTFSDPELRAFAEKGKQAGKQAGAGDEDKMKTAPLLWGYLVGALAGIAVGFAMPSGVPRKALLVLCCAAALLAAGGQAAAGFPIEQDIKEQKGDRGVQGGKQGVADEFIRVKYKLPFYLALVFAGGAMVTAMAEPLRPRRPQRPVYDFDEGPGGDGEPPIPDDPPRG